MEKIFLAQKSIMNFHEICSKCLLKFHNCASLCLILIHIFLFRHTLSTYLQNFSCHFLPLWKIHQFLWTALNAVVQINLVCQRWCWFFLFYFPFFPFFAKFAARWPVCRGGHLGCTSTSGWGLDWHSPLTTKQHQYPNQCQQKQEFASIQLMHLPGIA